MKLLIIIKQNLNLFVTKIWYSFYKRDKNLWVLGEWFGERCCDNCLYFANHVVNSHPEIELAWVSKPGVDLSLLDNKVKRLTMGSQEAADCLKRAGVVFMVHGMNDIIMNDSPHYYSGALTINFWHGTPWKKIHYDMPYNFFDKLYLRWRTSMYGGKIYLSNSDIFSKILNRAFDCQNNRIIKSGFPRNSIFFSPQICSEAKQRLLVRLGRTDQFAREQPKIVTYMPTFREHDDVFSFEKELKNKKLNEVLIKHNALLVQKSHFVTSQKEGNCLFDSERICFLKDYPPQELLASTDLLITDYSSCFFDFLVLDRPIIHYLYDYDYYMNDDRGVYFHKEEVVAGDVVDNFETLISAIDNNLSNPDKCKTLRNTRRIQFLQFESKYSCEKIFSEVVNML